MSISDDYSEDKPPSITICCKYAFASPNYLFIFYAYEQEV